jgi:hypothetical protein
MPLKDVACITPSTTRTIQVSISPTFYERICANFLAPKKFNVYFKQKKLRKNFLFKKAAQKMLVKLTTATKLMQSPNKISRGMAAQISLSVTKV